MRKTVLYVALWFAAGVAAVTLASAGVSMVGNQVTGSRPSPLSAAEVEAELTADEATTTTTAATSSSTTTAPGTPLGEAPAGTVTTNGGGPGATDPSSPTTVAAPPTTAPAVTRTYTLVGGTATLRFDASGVTVVVASPNPGYSVDTEPTHENGVRVEFQSEEHRSRVEGWWDGGPRDEVDESDASPESDESTEATDAE